MRIGMLAPPWVPVPPPAYGGTELVIDLLARELLRRGHDVRLFTTPESTCPVPKLWANERSFGLDMGNGAIEMAHAIAGYDALADCDVVHDDHTITGSVHAKAFSPIPVVTTMHGPLKWPLLPLYERISAAVAIIAISRDQASRATGIRIAGVIHHGINVDDFPYGPGTGDENGPYLLFLGRMAPEKGAHRAIDVARATGHRLIIAAKMREAREEHYFQEEVEPRLGGDIVFVGEADKETKLRLLTGASAVLNPICWPEPFGLVMVEAMACGTPVLALPFGAAPEIIHDGIDGFVCRDEAEMIERLPDALRIDRAACRRSVDTHFSVERMVDGHVALYASVVSRCGRIAA